MLINVNVNLSSNFVIEHFRSTDFHTVLRIVIYIRIHKNNPTL